jgi:anti-sigma-K factor RskA
MSTDIHTLAGAYALDALTDIERAAFARHVASCESCAQELAELSATVARLTDATAAVPPARLKSAVLDEVSRTRQVAPGRPGAVPTRVRRGWRGLVAAAAAAVVLAAGGGAVGWFSGRHDADAKLKAAQIQTAKINNLLTAPDAQVHTTKLDGGGQVTVITSPRLDQGVAVLTGMPKLADGQVYQLWLVNGALATSAGVMDPGVDTGTAFIDHLDGADTFGVSAERAGGADHPTVPLVTQLALNA